MKSKDVSSMVISNQIEMLKEVSKALDGADFITAGMLLKTVGSMCLQLAESMKPFAAIQFMADSKGSKTKMEIVMKKIDKNHKMILEILKDVPEGLPKQ